MFPISKSLYLSLNSMPHGATRPEPENCVINGGLDPVAAKHFIQLQGKYVQDLFRVYIEAQDF